MGPEDSGSLVPSEFGKLRACDCQLISVTNIATKVGKSEARTFRPQSAVSKVSIVVLGPTRILTTQVR